MHRRVTPPLSLLSSQVDVELVEVWKGEFRDLGPEVQLVKETFSLDAFIVFLQFVKLFKYFQLDRRMNQFLQVFARAGCVGCCSVCVSLSLSLCLSVCVCVCVCVFLCE